MSIAHPEAKTGLIIEKLTSSPLTNLPNHDIISIAEYRKISSDNISSDEQIRKRLNYLEAFCRNIAKAEINSYLKSLEIKSEQIKDNII